MHPGRVSVSLAARSYDVLIGRDVLSHLADLLRHLKPTSLLLVSDANVAPLHAPAVGAIVHGLAPMLEHVVPAGEGAKSLPQLGAVYDTALGSRMLDRRAVVIALGGGVVGDLAGFAAATLLRGVACIQLPTSLLAMVDSSVGGKTAINHPAGKNLIGAFHQPAGVICELAFLDTLPRREYVSALAEVVKTAAIGDPALLTWLETRQQAILNRDQGALAHLLRACISFKAGVVQQDETETTGRRAILNFGHSLAHTLETAFPGRFLHGEAVSMGIAAALRLSTRRAGLDEPSAGRVVRLLRDFGLPVEPPAEMTPQMVIQLLASDKKREAARVNFVALQSLGQPTLLPCTPDDDLAGLLLGRGHG